MRKAIPRCIAFCMLLGCVAAWPLLASAQEGGRKVKAKADPVYPELAKSMHLVGMVKLEVTIAPNGTVKAVKVLGGNPVLVQAAQEAVKKWKFENSPDETSQVMEFRFAQ